MKRYAWALLGCVCTQAMAQDSPYTMSPGTFSNYLYIQPMVNILEDSHRTIFGQSMEQSLRGGATSAGQRARVSTVLPAANYSAERTERTIGSFTAGLPAAQRASAAGVFRELLQKYGALERQFGIAPRDVAGAVAAYVAGCHMAYHNAPFPDAHFKPLVQQMQRTLAAHPDFARIPVAERQSLYDELALGGMLLAAAQMANQSASNPQAIAHLREAAGRQLRRFLGTDPERVRITAAGLSLN